jgi:hypothetical protein
MQKRRRYIMHRRTLVDIENRAIKNFKVHGVDLPPGRHMTVVTTLQGVVIEQFESGDKAEAKRHLCDLGYERIPSYVAFEIDQAASP